MLNFYFFKPDNLLNYNVLITIIVVLSSTYMQNHNDTINKQMQEDFSTNMYLSLYCKGSKRVTRGLRVRGSWRPNRNCNILTPTLMAVSVVSFLFSWCSTGGPEAHSAGWWLSLLHLISIFSGPQWLSLPHLVYNSIWPPTATLDFCLDWVI